MVFAHATIAHAAKWQIVLNVLQQSIVYRHIAGTHMMSDVLNLILNRTKYI